MKTSEPGATGFTLLEMMVVLALMGLMATWVQPSFLHSIAKSQAAQCQSRLMQALQAQEQYRLQYPQYAFYPRQKKAAEDLCAIEAQPCPPPAEDDGRCVWLKAYPDAHSSLSNKILDFGVDTQGQQTCTLQPHLSEQTLGNAAALCWR